MVMETESVGVKHTPLEIVQPKTYVPAIIPVTVLAESFGFVMTGVLGPLRNVHVPVPADGAFPAREVPVTLQSSWSPPASTDNGELKFSTCMVSLDTAHTPFDIVQLNRYVPTTIPVTVFALEEESVITGEFGPL